MIIVEGPDGAGKTTLVNRLSADLSLKIGIRGTINRDELWKVTREDTYRALSEAMHGPPQIWDRLYFSDDVYTSVGGRPRQFSPKDRTFIESILGVLKCPIIWCLPPLSIVEENIQKTYQMIGITPNIKGIYKLYDSLGLSIPSTPRICYDYTQEPYEFVATRCQEYLAKREDR